MGKDATPANITASLYDGEEMVSVECRDGGRHCKYARFYTDPREPGDDPACMGSGGMCGNPFARREALLALRAVINSELAEISKEFKDEISALETKRNLRVTNGANGLFARMAEIRTGVVGYAVYGLMFVEESAASRFNRAEAQVVQMMCELHAERFKIVAWQGNFRIEEVRA